MPSAFSRLHSKVFCTTEYLLAHGFLNTVLSFFKFNHFTLLILQKTPNEERKRLLFLKTHIQITRKTRWSNFKTMTDKICSTYFYLNRTLSPWNSFAQEVCLEFYYWPPLVCCSKQRLGCGNYFWILQFCTPLGAWSSFNELCSKVAENMPNGR